MASTIKGITVKIAGDTIDLQKSLKAVQSSSSSLQTELTAINRQLKFDPENTVLLAQKQEVLKEQIEKSQSALNQLLNVQDQVEEQAKNGEISTEQYRAYQREVEKAKSKLETFKKQLAETEEKANEINLESARTEMSKTETSVDKAGDSFKGLETKSNNTDLSKVKKEMDGVKSSADELKSAVGDAIKEAGAAVTTVGGALAGTVVSANSEEKALNSLQAQTGLTVDELSKYENIIDEIYKDNFGESQEDIANTLAKIKQITDEQDPEKLKSMAENLYTLEGTFENFDISETLRGINGLMTNMGLSAEKAFDYIVKGAQNGLNYSGELGDNIAEYSQIWGQAGFSAEQMFSILENGTKNGAYNLDKVNDFVKEFTISLADGRIEENLNSFSKGTGDVFYKWKIGKKTASDVFYSVINDLKNTKNEQKALTIASTVWSALGEDNALKVIKSLGNVNKSYKNVKGSMKKIKDIKYDDVEADWESLGRTVQTDVINPIGKSLFPEVKNLCSFVGKHTDDIIPTLKKIGALTAGIWAGKKAAAVTKEVQSLFAAYKSLKLATDAAKLSQEGLNLAQKANVIGAITGLVVSLVGEIWAFAEANDEAKKSEEKLNEEHEKALEKIKELKDSNDDYVQSKKDAASEVDGEFQYYEDLWKELQKIVDKNGKVKKGYEDRAKFITRDLGEVTKQEIKWNGKTIDSYDKIKKSMDAALESKKALAMLTAFDEPYQNAVSGLSGAKTDTANAYAEMKKAKNLYNSQKKKFDKEFKLDGLNQSDRTIKIAKWLYKNGKIGEAGYKDVLENPNSTTAKEATAKASVSFQTASDNADSQVNAAKIKLQDATKNYEEFQRKVVEYNTTIQNVENLTAANASENIEQIRAAMFDLSNNLQTYTTGNKETLTQQVADFTLNVENLRTALKDNVAGVTQDQVEEAEILQKRAEIELAKYNDMYGTAAAIANGKAIEINESQVKITQGFITAETGSKKSLENQVTNLMANYELLKTAMDEGQPGVTQKMVDNAKKMVESATVELNKLEKNGENAAKKGVNRTADTIGSDESKAKIKKATKKITDVTADEEIVSTITKNAVLLGQMLSQGFSDGIANKISGAVHTAGVLVESVLDKVQNAQDSHSPSRKTRKLGSYFGEGFRLGIQDEISETVEAAREMTSKTLSSVDFNFVNDFNRKFDNIRNNESAASNNLTSNNITNAPTVELKIGDVIIKNNMDVDDFNNRAVNAVMAALTTEASKWGG